MKVEEIVQEVTNKSKQNRLLKNRNSLGFIVLILVSGILGLLASSLIFDIFSNSFQNQIPKKELLRKIK